VGPPPTRRTNALASVGDLHHERSHPVVPTAGGVLPQRRLATSRCLLHCGDAFEPNSSPERSFGRSVRRYRSKGETAIGHWTSENCARDTGPLAFRQPRSRPH
jgi:hypothetical protein